MSGQSGELERLVHLLEDGADLIGELLPAPNFARAGKPTHDRPDQTEKQACGRTPEQHVEADHLGRSIQERVDDKRHEEHSGERSRRDEEVPEESGRTAPKRSGEIVPGSAVADHIEGQDVLEAFLDHPVHLIEFQRGASVRVDIGIREPERRILLRQGGFAVEHRSNELVVAFVHPVADQPWQIRGRDICSQDALAALLHGKQQVIQGPAAQSVSHVGSSDLPVCSR